MDDRSPIIAKYEQTLKKANDTERLRCHVLGIQRKIDNLKDPDYKLTTLDELWVDYFNGD